MPYGTMTSHPKPYWTGSAAVWGSSEPVQMALLTLCVAGLQFTWGVEMSYVNVYLLSLGMSKAWTSVVWLAGPISGLVMQPLIGTLSDKCTSRYGRRKPYMLGGSVFVTIGLVGMAWAPDIAAVFGLPEGWHRALTIAIAVMCICLTDVAINGVQACSRAIIVDTLPADMQQTGNGWASRMVAGGHLVGYFLGYLDLATLFGGWLGSTQLKALCVVSALALLVSAGATAAAVTERVLHLPESDRAPSVISMAYISSTLRSMVAAAHTLPRRVVMIFVIQFCAFYGWFSFLFYSATYVSEVYVKYDMRLSDDDNTDKVGELGRIGSMSLVVFSTVTLICSVVLPELIKKDSILARFFHRPSLLALDLTSLWVASHLVYAVANFLTLFCRSVWQATAVIGLAGFSWAITAWAPFALLAEEIHAIHGLNDDDNDNDTDNEPENDTNGQEKTHGSGVYIGMHNISISTPQLLSTTLSGLVFLLLQKDPITDDTGRLVARPGDGDGGFAIAVTFQLGALAALGAAYLAHQLSKMPRLVPLSS